MTLEEFDDIDLWCELEEFCMDYGYQDYIDDIRSDVDDYVYDVINNWGDDWRSLRCFLDNVPSVYDRYRIDDDGDIIGTNDGDDVFYDYKEEIRSAAIDNDEFEDEENNEDDEEDDEDDADSGDRLWRRTYETECDEVIKPEGFAVDTLFS